MGDSDLEKVLEKALQLPHAEPKAYETIAGIDEGIWMCVLRGVTFCSNKILFLCHMNEEQCDRMS